MGKVKECAAELAYKYCVIKSLDPDNEHDWDTAMFFVCHHPNAVTYIYENY